MPSAQQYFGIYYISVCLTWWYSLRRSNTIHGGIHGGTHAEKMAQKKLKKNSKQNSKKTQSKTQKKLKKKSKNSSFFKFPEFQAWIFAGICRGLFLIFF